MSVRPPFAHVVGDSYMLLGMLDTTDIRGLRERLYKNKGFAGTSFDRPSRFCLQVLSQSGYSGLRKGRIALGAGSPPYEHEVSRGPGHG
jgi:hypothetical protein